jgi:L-lactate utilization protein LutC
MTARGSSKDEILARLTGSLRWPKAGTTARPDAAGVREADRDALVESFAAKATAAGAEVRRVTELAAVGREIAAVIGGGGCRSAVISGEEIVRGAGTADVLAEAGIRVAPPQGDAAAHREACFSSDVGITGAFAGIAETGSIALVFDKDNPRLVSHAPFNHVALLSARDVVPDGEALFARLSERRVPPSAMAIVTGPSMTADIALTPIRGIHGPGRLVIILID